MKSAVSIAAVAAIAAGVVAAAALAAVRVLRCRGGTSRSRRGRANARLQAISGILGEFEMVPHLEAESADDAIVKLVRVLRQQGRISDEGAVLDSIRLREKSMPTGLVNSLAIPHGRTDAVNGLVGAIATVDNPNGIPNYETIDKSPVRIVILSVSSKSETVAHLNLLSDISRSLRDNESRQNLLACKDAAEMKRFISGR